LLSARKRSQDSRPARYHYNDQLGECDHVVDDLLCHFAIADEPAGNLDPEASAQILASLEETGR
jgi:hypothetical protein